MQLKNQKLLLTRGWIAGSEIVSEQQFDVLNPATLAPIARVDDLGEAHAKRALDAAAAAFEHWKSIALQDRAALIAQWAELIEKNVADLGVIVCSENGKPIAEAEGEIHQCVALLRWYAQAAVRLHGSVMPTNTANQRNFTIKQPIGVVACITPWNFPAAAVIVKAGAAIVAGCTAIVKPSDETPLIALALARLSQTAGIPAGVFNVLPCKDPRGVGDALCRSDTVRMLSFTGSTAVGKQLYSACGSTMKRIAFELGGNAPFIVFEDADIEKAVAGAVGARFYNGGQICVGANRFFVHKSIYKSFADRFVEKLSRLTIGDGLEPSTNIGPMINRAAIERLKYLVKSGVEMGGEVLIGGHQPDGDSLYFEPTVMTNMSMEMPAYHTEVFGPLACLYEFENEEEVLERANATEAGLSAYVYTEKQARLMRFCEALEAGVVGANSTNIFSNDMPFGGVKQSGVGREHGIDCLEEFVETKSIFMGF